MRNIVFRSPQGFSKTLQAEQGAFVRIGRGDGRPGEIAIVHQRDGSIDVKISVETLSTHHAELRVLSTGIAVKDLESTNGTLVPIAPGENRSVEGRILLGTEVVMEIDGAGVGLSEEIALLTPEDLVVYLGDRLRDVGCTIALVKGRAEKPNPLQTILPLLHGHGHLLVTWPNGTVDLRVDGRLRAAVNSFNLRNQSSANDWKFTALSPGRLETLYWARRAAPFEEPILLLGPSGCGKGVLAEGIHEHSRRACGPFVPINCTAIPESMFEREFFGHARGAFTGAVATMPGFVQNADGGTLFLDEIADMPLALQAKLLKFLDDGKFTPLGAAKQQSANVRIIAATNKDIVSMLGTGFREDLYYRLRPIEIPVAEPQAADLRAAIMDLAPDIAARNHVVLLREELEQLADLAAIRVYPGHFRDLKSTLARYLMVRENGKTIEQTWRMAMASMDTRPPTGELNEERPIPQANRDAFIRHMESYARLQLARRASSVTELAHQTQQTTQAVYASLKRRGWRPEDIGDTQVVRDAIATEVQALRPYRALLQDLLFIMGEDQ